MVWSVVVNASQSVVGLWRSYSGMVSSGECVPECGWVMGRESLFACLQGSKAWPVALNGKDNLLFYCIWSSSLSASQSFNDIHSNIGVGDGMRYLLNSKQVISYQLCGRYLQPKQHSSLMYTWFGCTNSSLFLGSRALLCFLGGGGGFVL